MKKPNLTLMSMEQLDRLSRNIGEESLAREGALRELAKRENRHTGRGIRQLTPRSYPAFALL